MYVIISELSSPTKKLWAADSPENHKDVENDIAKSYSNLVLLKYTMMRHLQCQSRNHKAIDANINVIDISHQPNNIHGEVKVSCWVKISPCLFH